jgi:hypothetical protein
MSRIKPLCRKIILTVFIFMVILGLAQTLYNYLMECKLEEESTGTVKKANYCIFIEIEDKTLYLLQDGKCIKKYIIASGQPDTPSPLGCWKIVSKGDWGEGFGGRWMGFNVPWGRYGIHGTTEEYSIGYDLSHGCIRMYNKDVKELYDLIPIGTKVVILNGCFGPFGTGFKSINPGDRGADVMAIQERLIELGYLKSHPTGIYEDDLKYALHRFQKANGLEVKNTISKKDFLKMGFKEFE